MDAAKLNLTTIVDPLFAENAYIAHIESQQKCLVIDPGLDPGSILKALDEQQVEPELILNTHGHADHIAGNAALKERWPDCPIVIGKDDAYKLADPDANLSAPFGISLTSPPADQLVSEGDTIAAAGFKLEVFDTPGHSGGHIIFVCRDFQPAVVFSGDVIFQNGVGRTDFPDGDFDALLNSIRQKIFVLDDDTILHTGHGPSTTVGDEKRTNPFVR